MPANTVTGVLPSSTWTRVVSGWGYYSIDYGISAAGLDGRYRAYTAPVPWPISAGALPNPRVTHRVIGYGDIWLWSPATTTYRLTPVFP